ncbi:hypothetical protein V8C86DRAFT_2959356 [Haematococcus lacustris]
MMLSVQWADAQWAAAQATALRARKARNAAWQAGTDAAARHQASQFRHALDCAHSGCAALLQRSPVPGPCEAEQPRSSPGSPSKAQQESESGGRSGGEQAAAPAPHGSVVQQLQEAHACTVRDLQTCIAGLQHGCQELEAKLSASQAEAHILQQQAGDLRAAAALAAQGKCRVEQQVDAQQQQLDRLAASLADTAAQLQAALEQLEAWSAADQAVASSAAQQVHRLDALQAEVVGLTAKLQQRSDELEEVSRQKQALAELVQQRSAQVCDLQQQVEMLHTAQASTAQMELARQLEQQLEQEELEQLEQEEQQQQEQGLEQEEQQQQEQHDEPQGSKLSVPLRFAAQLLVLAAAVAATGGPAASQAARSVAKLVQRARSQQQWKS